MQDLSTSPELAARLTAARAALADYTRESATAPNREAAAFWAHWAGRLGAALESVLEETADPDLSGVAQPGGGFISGPMIMPGRDRG